MRTFVLILCSILIAVPVAAGTTSLQITRSTTGDSYAKWERNGVRYITYDESLLDAIDQLSEQRRAHAELGRKHADLGRDYAAHGREHARLARELARASDGRKRAIEADLRAIERKQRELETRRNRLELERKQLEKTRDVSSDAFDDRMDELFERAVREGKAKRR